MFLFKSSVTPDYFDDYNVIVNKKAQDLEAIIGYKKIKNEREVFCIQVGLTNCRVNEYHFSEAFARERLVAIMEAFGDGKSDYQQIASLIDFIGSK
jgi:hypothetical protein